MARKAVVVFDTDSMNTIERNPELFVELIRNAINMPAKPYSYMNALGIYHVDTFDADTTVCIEILPNGQRLLRSAG